MTPLALTGLVQALGPRPDGPPAVLITVQRVQGSAPREEGAWMAVFADRVVNTLGGGHLEFSAIQLARQWLDRAADSAATTDASKATGFTRRFSLGPSLGQCCGGAVELSFQRLQGPLEEELRARLHPRATPVGLFGAGHVGQALVRVLSTLPFQVHWVDSRDEIFPSDVPRHVRCEHSDPVQAAVADLPPRSQVLVMSFNHAEDLDIVQACLQRQRQRDDLPFIGLIGSRTKWATFNRRLRERGFSAQECAQVTCPIGLPGIPGKQPEVIAVAVAAQLLQEGARGMQPAP